jgi:hypothetical protein
MKTSNPASTNQQIFVKSKITSRRAVAPIVGTLLLSAIAVIGGVLVFSLSQDSFASSQVMMAMKFYLKIAAE